MKESLADLLRRLSSRKFLLAVSAAVALLAAKQYLEAAIVVLGYLGAEGLVDSLGGVRADGYGGVRASRHSDFRKALRDVREARNEAQDRQDAKERAGQQQQEAAATPRGPMPPQSGGYV